MPKKLKPIEIFATVFFGNNPPKFSRRLSRFEIKSVFSKGPQWSTIIAIIGIFPAINTIFLNYYPFHKKVRYKLAYILVWSGFAILYEFMAVKSGYSIIMAGLTGTLPFAILFFSLFLLLY